MNGLSHHRSTTASAALVGALVALGLVASGCGGSSPSDAGHQAAIARAPGQHAPQAAPITPAGTTHAAGSAGAANHTAAPTQPRGLTPTTRPASGSQADVVAKLPGSASQSCVVAGTRNQVRAGNIAVGSIADARSQFHQQYATSQAPSVVLTVIPLHSNTMPGLTISMRQLGGAGLTRTVTSHDVESADVWRYYAVSMLVPAAGSWRLTVHAGEDSGCVDVTFSR